jgi:hypothetical protein
MVKSLNSFLKVALPMAKSIRMAELHADSPRAATLVGATLLDDVLFGAIRYNKNELTDDEAGAFQMEQRNT